MSAFVGTGAFAYSEGDAAGAGALRSITGRSVPNSLSPLLAGAVAEVSDAAEAAVLALRSIMRATTASVMSTLG